MNPETIFQAIKKHITVDNLIDVGTSGMAILTAFLVALFGILLSYNALYDLADSSSAIHKSLVWSWPLMLDSVAVVASICILWAEIRQSSAKYPWGLLIGFTVASVLFNGLHANWDWLMSQSYAAQIINTFVAVTPPIAAALVLHLLVTLMRSIFERVSLVVSAKDLADRTAKAMAELDRLTRHIETQQTRLTDIKNQTLAAKRANIDELNSARFAKIEQRRLEVLSLLEQGKTQTAISEILETSLKTIERDIATLKESGLWPKVTVNANGHNEVAL